MSDTSLIPTAWIERRILLLRGHKVMLDLDLATLYDTPAKVLNQAVKRNIERFPEDFMFQLSSEEARLVSRSQIVTLNIETATNSSRTRDPLRSPRAVQVNIEIMRAFVRLRQMLASNAELSRRLEKLEAKYDSQFKVVFDAIRELMDEPVPLRPKHGRVIGFQTASDVPGSNKGKSKPRQP